MEDNNDKWNIDIPADEGQSNSVHNPSTSTPPSESDVRAIPVNSLTGPAVVFVGPKESGKTTALLRLARFLIKRENCVVDVNRNFRADISYKESTKFFLDSLQNENWAPRGNAPIDFICVNVTKKSKQLCQFLEAPGESYYDILNPHDQSFAPYLGQLFSNRRLNKTMVFFFWDGMLLDSNPQAYSLRLSKILQKLDNKLDDVIIVYNKIDLNPALYNGILPNLKSVKSKLFNDQNYATFFNTLKDLRIQTQYVAFSSGDFQQLEDGRQRYVESIEDFPSSLWKALKFSITPGWSNKTKRLNKV